MSVTIFGPLKPQTCENRKVVPEEYQRRVWTLELVPPHRPAVNRVCNILYNNWKGSGRFI